MKRYKNLSGDSGVEAYELGPNFIKVRFRRRAAAYVYDHEKPGAARVARMRELAEAGRGLSAYISRYVRDDYARVEP